MAPLRRRWAEVKAEAEAKAAKRDLIAGSKPSPQKSRQLAKIEAELFGLLRGFRDGAGRGAGARPGLRQRQLPLRGAAAAARPGEGGHHPGGDAGRQPGVPRWSRPQQLHGIEINPYAHELAQATIWIGYIQWLRDNGFGLPGRADPEAAGQRSGRWTRSWRTTRAGAGRSEPEWPAADVIIGNPPFLGGKQDARASWATSTWTTCSGCTTGRVPGGRRPGVLLVREGAGADRGGQGEAGRAAGDAGRFAAARIARCWSGSRRLATSSGRESDRTWILDGAAVHVSMVGFDDGTRQTRDAGRRSGVRQINADLTAALI